jgi:hypothetical protein
MISHYKNIPDIWPKVYLDGTVTASMVVNRQTKPPETIGEKKYRFTSGVKRVVRSKCVALSMHAKTNKLTTFFVTLTTPDFVESNDVISKFLENCKKQKYVANYIWVRERQIRGANHWHVLFSSCHRSIPVLKFQAMWNRALKTSGFRGSKNSFRLGKRPRVDDVTSVAFYISKYLTKGSKDGESIRLTHSSRLVYKGVVTLSGCVDNNYQLQYVYKFTSPFVITFKFSPNVAFCSFVYTEWIKIKKIKDEIRSGSCV